MFSRSFNLQDMCIIAVVKNIDLFVHNETVPKKHIEFLFQAYSDEVFSKHKLLKKSINEDCMMWLLNPRVKKVTLPCTFHSKRIIEQLKTIATGITFLNLHRSKISENELNSIICCLPHVIHLDLSETSCSNETLTCIQKSCPDLESLNVSCCENVTDTGMEILCHSNLSLKNLNIMFSGVEPFGAAIILNGMTSLECVKFEDMTALLYEIGKNRQYNLTELLFDCFLDNPIKLIKACARMCPKLKKLHFEHPVNEKVLKACIRFQNLEELKMKSTHKFYALVTVNSVLTPILPISKNLKTLILSCVEISVLTLVEHFESLKNLYLKKVSFTPFEKKDVKVTNTNLITLVIKDIDMKINDVTYEAIALLISLSKNVTELHLRYFKNLPPEIFDVIKESMKNLTLVNFNYTSVNMHSLNQLFEIPSLASVIANCYENQEGISANNSLAKNASCSLSWRVMYDSDDDDDEAEEDSFDDDDDKYCYDDDSGESDIISDHCNSTDSSFDDPFWPYDENGDVDADLIDYYCY